MRTSPLAPASHTSRSALDKGLPLGTPPRTGSPGRGGGKHTPPPAHACGSLAVKPSVPNQGRDERARKAQHAGGASTDIEHRQQSHTHMAIYLASSICWPTAAGSRRACARRASALGRHPPLPGSHLERRRAGSTGSVQRLTHQRREEQLERSVPTESTSVQ